MHLITLMMTKYGIFMQCTNGDFLPFTPTLYLKFDFIQSIPKHGLHVDNMQDRLVAIKESRAL